MFDFIGEGLFDGIGEGLFSSLGEGIAAAFSEEGAAGESLFSGFARLFGKAVDVAADYAYYRNVYAQFKSTPFGHRMGQRLEHLADVAKGHSFIYDKLKELQHEPGIGELFNEYKQLGINLPSDDLLRSSFRKLSMLLHPDRHKGNEELFKMLSTANDAIGNQEKRALYEEAVRYSPGEVKNLLKDMSRITDWEAFKRETKRPIALLNGKTLDGAHKWWHELAGEKKVGIAFAAVTAIGMGIYGVAKYVDDRRTKHRKEKLAKEYPRVAETVTHQQQYEESKQKASGMAPGAAMS